MNLILESLRSAVHALRGHLLRTLLTLLSIITGVATIITIISIVTGMDKMVAREFSRMGTRVLYISRHQWGKEFFWRARPIGFKEVEALKRVQIAEYIVPTRETWATLSRKGTEVGGMSIIGTTGDYHLVREIPISSGRFFTQFESDRGQHVCVIGYEVFKSLFKDVADPVNEFIDIEHVPFRVIGVIEKQGNFLTTMNDIAADYKVFIPLSASDRMFGRWRGLEVMVSAPSEKLLDETEDECRVVLRAARGLKPSDQDNFGINRQEFILKEFQKVTKYLWAALVGIAALSLIVGGIGIMNIMLISVTERTNEIGVRKALGARRTHILLQFLLEALLVCWLGGIVGTIVGMFIAFVIASVTPLVFVISGSAIALGFSFTSATGIFFGLYPAVKASQKSPVEALRYE